MFYTFLKSILPELISILEIMGVVVIIFGSVRSFITFFIIQFKIKKEEKTSGTRKSSNVKLMLGRSLELGLEYKMGAEILKTVLIRDLSEIWILAAVIVLRAMLSILLHFELNTERKQAELLSKHIATNPQPTAKE